VISGNKTNGKNVPGICKNKSIKAYFTVGLKIIKMPIVTSHQPRIGINHSEGNQYTVFAINSFAGLKPNGFKIPNQKKIIAKEYLNKINPYLCITLGFAICKILLMINEVFDLVFVG
jgi:hypothetical protein